MITPVNHTLINEHVGLYSGGTALIVLGGASAKQWATLYANVHPDVLIIANGVNGMIRNANYWICTENMTRQYSLAQEGNAEAKKYMEMYQRESFADYKIVSHKSAHLINPDGRVIVNRCGYERAEYNPRRYGHGLLAGWIMRHPAALIPIRVGTVGAQCLHWSALLGVDTIHTIGYDLAFTNSDAHHAYDYPLYKADRFRRDDFAVEYAGLQTQWQWVESAQWLIEYVIPTFARHHIRWHDHSGGLLRALGADCAM